MKQILFFIFLFPFLLSAQDRTVDSLKLALKNAKHDTTRCNILNELVESPANGNDTVWTIYNNQLLLLAEKGAIISSSTKTLKDTYLKYLSNALYNKGWLAEIHGDIPKALEYLQRGLKSLEETKDKTGISYFFNHIGVIYYNQGDIKIALEYYHKSLRLREEIKDKYGIASSLNNIGTIYKFQGDNPKALEYFNRSLKISEEIKEKSGIASSLNYIGIVYSNQGNRLKALEYYEKSLKLYEDINDKKGIAYSLNNIGCFHKNNGNVSKALEYLQKSLKLMEEIKNKTGIAYALNSIGSTLYKQNKVTEAFDYATRSMETSKEIGFPINIKNDAFLLKQIYKKQKKYKEALEMYELEIQMRDSITNGETKKASIKKQFQYQYEKKAAADSVKNAEEQKVKNALLTAQQAQLKQEKTQRLALYGGLVLVVAFLGFVFNRFRVTQKQKIIIEQQKTKVDEAYIELNQQNEEIAAQRDEIGKQKHKVEEHQKEIIDSITYAKRLQEAILPSKDFVTEHLRENFILYKPKDLVAGDFYWAEFFDDKFLIAAADSTGHGVPGAMVSVVCSNALNRSLKEFGLTEPGQLLDKTRDLVLETFSKSSSEVKDGMDISLLCIDTKNKKITWSGANNPLWYINNSRNSRTVKNNELIEIKANKQPIGKTDNSSSFTTHEIEYISGTTFYLLTDGYADQFGGPKGKKFKYKQLEELLINNAHLELSIQSEILNSKFEEWKDGLEQVDDVCVIGIRI